MRAKIYLCHLCSLQLRYHEYIQFVNIIRTYCILAQLTVCISVSQYVWTEYYSWQLHRTVYWFNYWILWLTSKHKLALVSFSTTTQCFIDVCLDIWQQLVIIFHLLQEAVMHFGVFPSQSSKERPLLDIMEM